MPSNSLLCCTTYHATIMSCVFDVSQFAPLKQGIANFYNESSGLWESVWGEHMHHGKGGVACWSSSQHFPHERSHQHDSVLVLPGPMWLELQC
jgi:hypothetical protein